MIYLYYFLATISIIATLIPFLPSNHWSVVNFDYFRLQNFVLGAIIVGLGLFLFRFESIFILSFLALIGTLAYNFSKIYPYTHFHEKEIADTNAANFSLLCTNVLQTNDRYNDFAKIMRDADPDVFITMESNSDWEVSFQKWKEKYPYCIEFAQENFYGMHLYSKYEISEKDIYFLDDEEVPSFYAKIGEKNVSIFVCHPKPPAPGEHPDSSQKNAELLKLAEKVAEKGETSIVCGDLNDVSRSAVTKDFKSISGLLDPRVGRGFYSTFHAKYPIRFPLDHIFLSKTIKLKTIQRQPYFGSDHFAMFYILEV